MSDDTPTERFDSAGDSPTEKIAAPSEEVVEERKSRRLITILAIIGGLLLIAVLVVLILLLTKGSGSPTALPTGSSSPSVSATPSATPTKSATPTATPTPTPTATQAPPPPPPPPPSNDVSVDSFTAQTTSQCSSQTGNPVYLNILWSSTNGIAAYFGVNAAGGDAQANGMGWTLPPSGNQNDFPNGYVPYQFQCGNASTKYTITIVGTNGSKDSKTVKVVNTGDVY